MFITKTEYIAANEVAKEVPWLKGIVKELGLNLGRVQLHCDSYSVIYLAKHLVYLFVRFHKIRELIVTKEIFLENVHTLENVGDMTMNPVPTDKFKYCLDLIGVCSL